jgi:hypothetical protein
MGTHLQPTSLVLKVNKDSTQFFSTLLQSGAQFTVQSGTKIGSFLSQLPGFTDGYITERIQTIFLNGTATDDLDSALSGASCVLAITTAMPGLAGAIFRKNSHHATLRTTTDQTPIDTSIKETIVTLKLFSALAKERGPELLEEGVSIDASNLVSFLGYRPTLLDRITRCSINGREFAPEGLCEAMIQLKTIHLRVHT